MKRARKNHGPVKLFGALFALIFGIVLSFALLGKSNISAFAAEIGQAVSIEKIYSQVDINCKTNML